MDHSSKAAHAILGCVALSGCAADISALSQDPATVSAHQVVQGPMWTVTTDITRVNSTNTAATANGNGSAVNVPTNSTVNPAAVKPSAGTTLTPGTPTTAPGQ